MQKNLKPSWLLFTILLTSFMASADIAANCDVRRELAEKSGQRTYTVNQRARTLYMISRDLYGSEKNWNQIAKWNGLQAPYVLTQGQSLIIKNPNVIDEAKGNEALIKAWGNLNRSSMVKRLTDYNLNMPVCSPHKETVVEEKHQAPASPLMEPAPKVQVPPALNSTADVPHSTENESAPSQEGNEHKQWGFSAALTTSMFHIKSVEEETNEEVKIDSKLNYGVDLAVRYETTEDLSFSLTAGIEQIEIDKPSAIETLDKDQQSLLKFSFDVDYKVKPWLLVYGGLMQVQRPFYRPEEGKATIDAIFLPEISFGDELLLFEAGPTKTWLITEIGFSFAAKDSHHDVKPGYGYIAGLKLDYEMNHKTVSLTPAYRYLKEDTKTAKEEQQAIIASLGFQW